MEEAQNKLKELMKKAQKQNVNLREIQAIKKRGSLFRIRRKFMAYAVLLACFILHGYFGDLINSEKVSLSFRWLKLVCFRAFVGSQARELLKV